MFALFRRHDQVFVPRSLARRNLPSLLTFKFLNEYGYDKGEVVVKAIVADICETIARYYKRKGRPRAWRAHLPRRIQENPPSTGGSFEPIFSDESVYHLQRRSRCSGSGHAAQLLDLDLPGSTFGALISQGERNLLSLAAGV